MSTDPFEPFLRAQGVVVLDGGLATALEAYGQNLTDPLWSARVLLDAPDVVRAVHRDYLAAGADCIATVTYQATFEGFSRRGLSDAEAEEALASAVSLAVEERDRFWADSANREGRLRPLVAASVGPYGAYLADGSEYTGAYDLDEDGLVAFHRRRWDLLARSDADLLGCETIPSLPETRALLRLLDETPERWGWISFQCRDEGHLADGSELNEALEACDGAERLSAVGFNCIPPSRVPGLLARARRVTGKPLVVYPNSGEGWDAERKVWTSAPEELDLAAGGPAWKAQGASVMGGCCRTGPDSIARLRKALLSPS